MSCTIARISATAAGPDKRGGRYRPARVGVGERVPDGLTEGPGHRRREGVAHLPVGGGLPALLLRPVREALQPGHHQHGQLGRLVWPGRPARAVRPAMPRPFTPSSCQAARARFGPQVRPAVLSLPPTIVGAMPLARAAQLAAPGPAARRHQVGQQPRRPWAVQLRGRRGPAERGRPRRLDRDQHEPRPELRHPVLARVHQVPPGLASPGRAACPGPGCGSHRTGRRPGGGRSPAARPAGRASSTRRSACGNRSRSSSRPSCLPAMENGGQGTPPENRSMPA